VTKYQVSVRNIGPGQWTYGLAVVMGDGHLEPLHHGTARSHDDATTQAEAWADWYAARERAGGVVPHEVYDLER
jgi:hypothetical protein